MASMQQGKISLFYDMVSGQNFPVSIHLLRGFGHMIVIKIAGMIHVHIFNVNDLPIMLSGAILKQAHLLIIELYFSLTYIFLALYFVPLPY